MILIGISGFPAAMPEYIQVDHNLYPQIQFRTCPKSFLNSVNSLIGEAGTLKVCPDLDGLLCELPLDVLNKDGLCVLVKVQRVEKAAKTGM